jgi:predicted secreted hydrolase
MVRLLRAPERWARGAARSYPLELTLPATQYRLGTGRSTRRRNWIQTYRRHWEGRLERLGTYLERGRNATASHDLRPEQVFDAARDVLRRTYGPR